MSKDCTQVVGTEPSTSSTRPRIARLPRYNAYSTAVWCSLGKPNRRSSRTARRRRMTGSTFMPRTILAAMVTKTEAALLPAPAPHSPRTHGSTSRSAATQAALCADPPERTACLAIALRTARLRLMTSCHSHRSWTLLAYSLATRSCGRPRGTGGTRTSRL